MGRRGGDAIACGVLVISQSARRLSPTCAPSEQELLNGLDSSFHGENAYTRTKGHTSTPTNYALSGPLSANPANVMQRKTSASSSV